MPGCATWSHCAAAGDTSTHISANAPHAARLCTSELDLHVDPRETPSLNLIRHEPLRSEPGVGRAVALRQNSNRLDLDFVGRIGQLLDLYQRVGRRIRAYVLCAHGSDVR